MEEYKKSAFHISNEKTEAAKQAIEILKLKLQGKSEEELSALLQTSLKQIKEMLE